MAGMNFMQSDIFAYFEKSGAGMKKRMQTIVTQPSATEIINDRLEEPLTIFAHTFKEPIAMRAVTAVRQGKLVLFIPKQDVAPPECLPFFRYTKGGESKVAVNMMNVVDVAPGGSTGELYYSVSDMRKFYSVLVAAYINLVIPEPSDYPVKAMEFGALMWAKMFCKILNTTIGLATSRDRYAAFFHYAVRFFLTYYIGALAATVDAIAKATLKGNDANPYVMAIAEYLDSDPKQAAKFYGSFTGFCEILFDNQVTNLKAARMNLANPNETLNVSFYLKRYIDSYYQSSVLALASVHYFTWMLICTQKRAFMMNVKMLSNVFDLNTEMTRYLAAVYSEAEQRQPK